MYSAGKSKDEVTDVIDDQPLIIPPTSITDEHSPARKAIRSSSHDFRAPDDLSCYAVILLQLLLGVKRPPNAPGAEC